MENEQENYHTLSLILLHLMPINNIIAELILLYSDYWKAINVWGDEVTGHFLQKRVASLSTE